MINISEQKNIFRLTLNRPDKRNALSLELIQALYKSLDAIEENPSARALIIDGAGKSFCSGMDLRGVIDNPEAMRTMLQLLSKVYYRLRKLQIPTIACVQGAAVGGGCGLMVVCDFAFTHPEAKLGYPEVDLGVCPAVVAPWLIKKIGAGKARAMLLAGGTITGTQGFASGLVTHVCKINDLESDTFAFAQNLAFGAKNAIAVTKHWVGELDGSFDEEVFLKAANLSADIIAGEEAQIRLKELYK